MMRSTAPATPYISEACDGLSPKWSAHNGITAVREARRAVRHNTPRPEDNNTRQCSLANDHIVGLVTISMGLVVVDSTCDVDAGSLSSRMNSETITAIPMHTAPTANAPCIPIAVCAAAPKNGPIKEPTRSMPPSNDMARARCEIGTATARYDWRARLNPAPAIPISRTPTGEPAKSAGACKGNHPATMERGSAR